MKEQMEIEQLSQVIDNEREDQIKKLKDDLAEAENHATNNKAAAEILTDLMSKGKIRQESDGSFEVQPGPNIIMNQHDVEP